MKNKINSLQRAITKLPVRKPRKVLWNSIEAELNTQEKEVPLIKAIHKLPLHRPDSGVWNKITASMTKHRATPWYYAAAASLVILFVSYFAYVQIQQTHTSYTSVENPITAIPELDFSATDSARAFIERRCNIGASDCKDPRFEILNSAYYAIGTAINKTDKMLSVFPNDPDLNRQMLKYKKEEAGIVRDMLSLTL